MRFTAPLEDQGAAAAAATSCWIFRVSVTLISGKKKNTQVFILLFVCLVSPVQDVFFIFYIIWLKKAFDGEKKQIVEDLPVVLRTFCSARTL